MYYRRKYLLSLFELFGNELTARKLQKLLFLSLHSPGSLPLYDFIPNKYGSFSFQAEQDMHVLVTLGYLAEEQIDGHNGYKRIKKEGMLNDLGIFDKENIVNTWDKFKDFGDDDLIRYVYLQYPFYAINSIIAINLLNADEMQRVEKEKSKVQSVARKLFTIGYEGLSLEAYLIKLLTHDVHVLCDVRKNAYSQKFGFSQSLLKRGCESVKIDYIHIPELGIESEKRKALSSQEDYNELFEEYERTTLSKNEEYLNIILDSIKDKKRVALTCFEKNPLQCHRTRVANAILKKMNGSISLCEL
jgi:hypothetical protein